MAAISTCLSTGRPSNPANGDILFETDTLRLIIWSAAAGGGVGAWMFQATDGFQFPTINNIDLLNYTGGKTTPDLSSPYMLDATPQIHLDARFIDGVDAANNPASGTPIAEIVNRSNGTEINGPRFIAYDASVPKYMITDGRRMLSSETSNRWLGVYDSLGTTGMPISAAASEAWTMVHIARHNPILHITKPMMAFPFNKSSNPSSQVGNITSSLSWTNLGWPAQGISSPYPDAVLSGYSKHIRPGDDPRLGLQLDPSILPDKLLSTESITDAEKASLFRNLWGLTDNNIQLWIGRKDASGGAIWYMNGAFKLADGPGGNPASLSNTTLELSQVWPFGDRPYQFWIEGDVFETLYFNSALSLGPTGDLQKILDYAIATYDVGALTGTKDF